MLPAEKEKPLNRGAECGVNVKVSWVCEFSDGSLFEEESPRWIELGIWKKWTYFRYMEYFDNIRTDANKAAWNSFGRYIKNACENAATGNQKGLKVDAVKIFRHWATISNFAQWQPLMPRPFVDFREKFKFFEEKYQ